MNIRKCEDNVTVLTWTVEELQLDVLQVAESIGYPRQTVPSRILQEIEDTLRECANIIQPVALVRLLPGAVQCAQLTCGGQEFVVGAKIAARIAGFTSLAWFVSSIGQACESASAALTAAGELLRGYILDSIGSCAAERTAELVERYVRDVALNRDLSASSRFRPGYCDWHVASQRQLFELIDGTRIGVQLTASAMMRPVKSVSGFVAVGSDLENGYACATCDRATSCVYINSVRR